MVLRKIFTILICALLYAGPSFSQEEMEYKKFKFDDSSCDVGVRYKIDPQLRDRTRHGP
jgi:hypothetical protein